MNGCGGTSETSESPEPVGQQSAAESAAEPPAEGVIATTNPPIRFASWDEIRDTAFAGDRITVVDFWSTACVPCLAELPHLQEVHQAFPDRVQCLGVAVDYTGRKSRPPKYYEEAIAKVLRSFGAEFTTYICETPSDDVFADIDIPSIPAVFVYDQTGNLIKRFVDGGPDAGFNYTDDVIPLLDSMLKE